MFDIVTVGSATLDVFLRSPQFRIETKEEERLVLSGDKIEVEKALISVGGGGTNTGVGFARLGFKTACVARLGRDQVGSFVIRKLKKEPLNLRYLRVLKGEETDFSIILLSPDGERIILVSRGKTRLDEAIFPFSVLKKTRFLYLASLEGNISLLEKIIGQAKENNVTVILNPGRRELSQKKRLASLLPLVKMVILNEEEAKVFWGENYLARAKKEKPVVVITQGSKGALWLEKEEVIKEPVVKTEVKDTTGAGDAFSVGLVAGLMWSFPPKKCLSLAMKESASVISHLGAKEGLLRKKELFSYG